MAFKRDQPLNNQPVCNMRSKYSLYLPYTDHIWVDNSTVDFVNWNSGEPNGNGNENCVHMYATGEKIGKWNDRICSHKFGYICQIPKIKTLVIPVPPATRSGLNKPLIGLDYDESDVDNELPCWIEEE